MTTELLASRTQPDLDEATRKELMEIEENATAFTLADAIREGAKYLKATTGWGDGKETGCALTAANYAMKNRSK